MARPFKKRFIGTPPRRTVFKPQEVPLGLLAVLTLSLDEIETLRLADLEGDDQEQAAAKMNISRATFGRILVRARRTVADALLHGKALQIAGGPVTTTRRGRVLCRRCGRQWEVPVSTAAAFHCPRCPRKKRA